MSPTKAKPKIVIDNYELPHHVITWALNEFNLSRKYFVDMCATKKNRRFIRYVSKKEDLFKITRHYSDMYANPPFNEIPKFINHLWKLHEDANNNLLMLLPNYTDSKWYIEFIGDHCEKVDDFRFLHTRLGFLKNNKPIRGENGLINKYFMPCGFYLWRAKR